MEDLVIKMLPFDLILFLSFVELFISLILFTVRDGKVYLHSLPVVTVPDVLDFLIIFYDPL